MHGEISNTPIAEPAVVGESGPTTSDNAFPLDRLRPAPWNPRKHFDEAQLNALSIDISAHGILEPLVVRDLGEHHEIVCGERRYRAALRAGLAAVPVVIRVLDDRAALECALSENGQREDLHPLEEADGFLELHAVHKVPVDEIAARIGMRPAYVHGRLALAKLCPEARTAFTAGKITTGIAQRVARLPSHDFQRAAVEEFSKPREQWQGQLTVADAGRWIEQRYHLSLANAPFDPKDATLTSAGACGPCPKNTATQGALFEDAPSRAECMDHVCFSQKREVTWERATVEQRNAGRKILSANESAQVVGRYGDSARGYALVDEKPYEHEQGRKTWKQLLGTHMPETVVARGPTGDAVELIEPEALKAAVKAAGLGKTKKSGGSSKSTRGGGADWKAKQKERIAVVKAFQGLLLSTVAEAHLKRKYDPEDRAWWQAVAKTVVLDDVMALETLATYLKLDLAKKRKGVSAGSLYNTLRAAFVEEIEVRTAAACREIIVLAFAAGSVGPGGVQENAQGLMKLYGIDPKAIEKRAIAERKAAKKVEPPPAKPGSKTPSKKPATKAGKSTATTKPAAKKVPAKGARS